jgi:uncharacterized protein YjiS (DUF1127 family)
MAMNTINASGLLGWSGSSTAVTTTSKAGVPLRILEVVRHLWERFRGWQAQRQTVRLLHSVDGATLRDLGISLLEIEGLVYGSGDDRKRHYDSNWWRK